MTNTPKLKAVEATATWPLQLYLTYRLSVLSAKLNRQAGMVLKRAGNLRVPEWRILSLLLVHREMNGSEVTDIVGFDPGLISRTFRALEQRGLISVRRTDDDRRSAYMSLTRAGRALHAKVQPMMERRQRHLLSALTAEERAAFLRIVDKLQVAADARDFTGHAP